MSTGGQQQYAPPGGYQSSVGSVYGKSPVQTPAWGGPGLRYGDPNPGVNAGYAAQAMPGTPGSYQQMFSGLAGTPWTSPGGVNQYGRWNWASQMPQQSQQPQQPGQPYQPPAPYQPPTQQQQPAPSTPSPQVPGSGTGGTPTPTNPYAGGSGNVNYTQQAIDRGMTQGDIWSNPAFANMVAGLQPGHGLFG